MPTAARLHAGSLLQALLFAFYAALPSRRALPLKRKDYYHRPALPRRATHEGSASAWDGMWSTHTSSVRVTPTRTLPAGACEAHPGAQAAGPRCGIRVGASAEHVPIIGAVYLLCGVDEVADECVLPWAE